MARKSRQTKRRRYGGNICSITREQTRELFEQIISRIPESDIDAETKKSMLKNKYLPSNFFGIINKFCQKHKIYPKSKMTDNQIDKFKKDMLTILGPGVNLETSEVETIFKLIKENSVVVKEPSKSVSFNKSSLTKKSRLSSIPENKQTIQSNKYLHPCPSLDNDKIVFSKVNSNDLPQNTHVFVLTN